MEKKKEIKYVLFLYEKLAGFVPAQEEKQEIMRKKERNMNSLRLLVHSFFL